MGLMLDAYSRALAPVLGLLLSCASSGCGGGGGSTTDDDSCRVGDDCPQDMTCFGGRCRPGVFCEGDDSCHDDDICRAEQCRAPDWQPSGGLDEPCHPDGTCDPDLQCREGTCRIPEVGTEGAPCGEDDRCDPDLWCLDDRCLPLELHDLVIAENPNSTLSARVTASTSHPCQLFIEFGPAGGSRLRTGPSDLGTSHALYVVNMTPSTEYRLRVAAKIGATEVFLGAEHSFTTGELPTGFPQVEITVHHPELMQPGVTLFGLQQRPTTPPQSLSGQYLGVDPLGQVIWYYAPTKTPVDSNVTQLPDGNLLLPYGTSVRVISIGGDLVKTFAPAGLYLHHDASPVSGDRLLAMVRERREIEVPWASGAVQIVGDKVIEVDDTGQIHWEWSSFDHLDTRRCPERACFVPDNDGSYFWTFANAVTYLAEEDAVLLSLRYQNWVLKIDRATSEIVWRLGEDGDFELTNLDPGAGRRWFYLQHAPEYHADGRVVVFDNGRSEHVTSRAVVYQLDEAARQAEQVWALDVGSLHAGLGDADLLANGNILVTAGSPISDGVLDPSIPASIIEATMTDPPQDVWTLEAWDYNAYRAARLESFWVPTP